MRQFFLDEIHKFYKIKMSMGSFQRGTRDKNLASEAMASVNQIHITWMLSMGHISLHVTNFTS